MLARSAAPLERLRRQQVAHRAGDLDFSGDAAEFVGQAGIAEDVAMDLAGLEEELPARGEIAHLGDRELEGSVGDELVGVQVELRREAGIGGGAQ